MNILLVDVSVSDCNFVARLADSGEGIGGPSTFHCAEEYGDGDAECRITRGPKHLLDRQGQLHVHGDNGTLELSD